MLFTVQSYFALSPWLHNFVWCTKPAAQIDLAVYITLIQTINDPDLKGVTQNLRPETAPSTASGPFSTASDEDPGPDPNATYAQVNIEQKRASRRQREKEHQQQEGQQSAINMDAIDSWV